MIQSSNCLSFRLSSIEARHLHCISIAMSFLFKPRTLPAPDTPSKDAQSPATAVASANPPQAPSQTQVIPPSSTPTQITPTPQSQTFLQSITTPRSRKQLSLFFGGAFFLCLTSVFTRRILAYRYRSTNPLFFHQSTTPHNIAINGPIEAFQALNVATFTLGSTAMMLGGGLLWAFDISTLDELRRKVRGGLGVDGTGRDTRRVEEEFEEWLAQTLQRRRERDEKRQKGEEVDEEAWKKGEGYTTERGQKR